MNTTSSPKRPNTQILSSFLLSSLIRYESCLSKPTNLEPLSEMSVNEQPEYQKLISEHRELEKENLALRCNNMVMREVVSDHSHSKLATS